MLHVHKKYKKWKGDERACPGRLQRLRAGFGEESMASRT